MNKRGTMLYPEDDARYIPFTPEQLQALADMYLGGKSIRWLAGRYGISQRTVRARLVTLGVELREAGKNHVVTDQVLAVARHMLTVGAGWRAVTWATGVQADSIMNAMRRQRQRAAE